MIQVPGRIAAGALDVHFHQVYGYDVINETLVSWAFDSDGTRWEMTSGSWEGRTLFEKWVGTRPDGSLVAGRCSFEHTPDYSSMEGQCEWLTDGKWWINRKVKGAKVN